MRKKKHMKKFSIKNLGPPRPPPLMKFFMLKLFMFMPFFGLGKKCLKVIENLFLFWDYGSLVGSKKPASNSKTNLVMLTLQNKGCFEGEWCLLCFCAQEAPSKRGPSNLIKIPLLTANFGPPPTSPRNLRDSAFKNSAFSRRMWERTSKHELGKCAPP